VGRLGLEDGRIVVHLLDSDVKGVSDGYVMKFRAFLALQEGLELKRILQTQVQYDVKE